MHNRDLRSGSRERFSEFGNKIEKATEKPKTLSEPKGLARTRRVANIKLHQILRHECQQRGMTIKDLASQCSIPVSLLHSWMSEISGPSAKNLHHIKRLSEFLDLPLGVLLFNTKEDGESKSEVLLSSVFHDNRCKYRLTIEKFCMENERSPK
jgi:transcriptional regulator with XRE-family HTH domain